MTRAMLRRRLRALSHDERGFTILETVIAITVMFASLVALAYTATIGFKSIAYSRERVTFDGVADRIMEEIRGQAYTKIQTGLLTSDLTGDPNIINCGGTPIVYRFESCSTGEKIVSSGGVAATPSIYPHSGTVAGAAISNDVGYTWSTYITNDDPTTQPYRVTVIVRWASAAYPNKTNNVVRVQSLFASPAGCVSSSTHPFAAPCQPFFYGLAQVPAGKITVTGTVQGLTFSTGYLQTTGTESNLQNEQVTQGRATFAESLASITDGLGTRTEGGVVSGAQAADSTRTPPAPLTARRPRSPGPAERCRRRAARPRSRSPRPPATRAGRCRGIRRRRQHLPAADRPRGDGRASVRRRSHAARGDVVVRPFARRPRPGPGFRDTR